MNWKWKQIPAIHLRSISSAMFAMGINLSPFTCTISSSPQWVLYWCWWSCSSFMMLFEHEEQPISMDRWHKNQSWFLTFGIVLRCVAGRYCFFLIHIFSETISLFRNPNLKKDFWSAQDRLRPQVWCVVGNCFRFGVCLACRLLNFLTSFWARCVFRSWWIGWYDDGSSVA